MINLIFKLKHEYKKKELFLQFELLLYFTNKNKNESIYLRENIYCTSSLIMKFVLFIYMILYLYIKKFITLYLYDLGNHFLIVLNY